MTTKANSFLIGSSAGQF